MSTSIRPWNAEREFDVHELFFSTTDKRGVITAGNDVFVRVSGYAREELTGRPHNIIRHPEMPRAAFWLLWQYLQGGKSIAAYVKNMAKDGRFYWVLALVIPVEDGYVSVRLKPTSSLFPVVQKIYPELLALEQSYGTVGEGRREGMAASAVRLGEILASSGFDSYDSFMQTALIEEMKCRDRLLGLGEAEQGRVGSTGNLFEEDPTLRRLHATAHHCSDIQKHFVQVFRKLDDYLLLYDRLTERSQFILNLSHVIGRLSLNATIESARLRQEGVCLSVIADWMRSSSHDIFEAITDLSRQMKSVGDRVKQTSFDIAASRLNIEMMSFFLAELMSAERRCANTSANGNDRATHAYIHHLSEAFSASFQGTGATLSELNAGLCQLAQQLDCVLILIRTLGFAHVIGKVETARLHEPSGFVGLFEEVFTLIQDARCRLEELMQALGSVDEISLRTGEIEAFLTALR